MQYICIEVQLIKYEIKAVYYKKSKPQGAQGVNEFYMNHGPKHWDTLSFGFGVSLSVLNF